MLFNFAKPTALLALALSPMASALRYAGFASTISCTGPNFFCEDGGDVCCRLPTGFGVSNQFLGLPLGTQGQGYTGSTCGDFLFAVFGPGDRCWNGGGARASHINWFHSPSRNIDIRDVSDNSTCGPSGFTYQEAAGVEKSIQVPLGEADNIVALYTKKNFAALSNYPEY